MLSFCQKRKCSKEICSRYISARSMTLESARTLGDFCGTKMPKTFVLYECVCNWANHNSRSSRSTPKQSEDDRGDSHALFCNLFWFREFSTPRNRFSSSAGPAHGEILWCTRVGIVDLFCFHLTPINPR